MFQNLRRVGVAALLTAMIATTAFAQENSRKKFVISGPADKVLLRHSEPSAPKGGIKRAIVIAVSDLNDKVQPPLPFAENDARRLIETLYNDGFVIYPVCEKSVPTPKGKRVKPIVEPTKENIEKTVEDVLKTVGKNDVLFVYFSGHGLNRGGDSMLFAKNSSSEDDEIETSCVSVAKLRKMIADREKEVQKAQEGEVEPRCVLAIDACHAGTTRSAYAELEDFIPGGAPGVATLASCSLEEESLGWTPIVVDPNDVADGGKDRDVSVFTYWLNLGMKGFADGALAELEEGREANGKIESDELYMFVHDNVRMGWDDEQTTQAISQPSESALVLCDVPTANYDAALYDVAKQIVTKAKLLRKRDVDLSVKAVGLEKHKGDAKAADGLESFARYVKGDLQANVDGLLDEALDKGGFDGRGAVDVDATVELAEREIVDDEGNAKTVVEYVVTCVLDDSKAAGNAGVVKARVLVKEAGDSERHDVAPANARPIGSAAPAAPAASPALGDEYEKPAPVASGDEYDDSAPNFVLPQVTVEAKLPGAQTWTARTIYRDADGANWVELNPGETYRVVVAPSNVATNPETVGLRLLVDGRNTLPQAEPQLYAASYVGTRSAVAEPLVRLDDARWWALDLAKGCAIGAFYKVLEQNGDKFEAAGREFRVAAVDAIGASTTGQNGAIDVAFYALKDRENGRDVSDVLTDEGGEVAEYFDALVGKEISHPLASFRLRYASAARLAELGVAKSELVGSTTVAAAEPFDADEAIGTRSATRSKKTTTSKKRTVKKYREDDEDAFSEGVLR
ncbi:MAG: caspase family protein [Thermoguttaceae bacterium]|nr:caspase family protein [Thermoguttaceae bacterium]